MSAIEKHSELLQEFTQQMYREVTSAEPNWVEAYYDFRLECTGTGLDRFILRDANSSKALIPSQELTQVRDCLQHLREKTPGGRWFGLFIHLDSKGNVDVKYDHNPDCIDTFFDDLKSHRPF